MNTAEVASKLVSLCQQGKFDEAMNETYGENIVSLEAFDIHPGAPGQSPVPRETRGLAAVRKKAEWWNANHIIHSATVVGPFVAQDKFAVEFNIDVTFKPTGKRHAMTEVAVYTVANGKIIHEEFLYKQ